MVVDLAPVVQIDSADMFYIQNHHPSRTLTFYWSKYPYVIGPGKQKIVPFDVVCLYFGDPRSKAGAIQTVKDSKGTGTVPERFSEVQRLAVRYGVYEQGMESIAEAIEDENARLKEIEANAVGKRVKPLIDDNFHAVITTLEGERVITPLFDHDGSVTYGYTLDDDRSDDVATIIKQMRARIDQLEGKKADIAEHGENDDDGVEFDNPTGP